MIRVVPILFGALFTIATAWSLGMLLLRNLAPSFDAWERRLLAFVAGSACLSEIMFALSAARLVHRGVLLALGLAIIGYAAYSGALRSPGKTFAPLAPLWRWIFVAAFAAFTWYGFFNALAPEHSSDGMAYHLSEVLIYQHAHGFPRITNDMYANLSQGIELLFLFAFDFGRHSAASSGSLHLPGRTGVPGSVVWTANRTARRGCRRCHLHLHLSSRAARRDRQLILTSRWPRFCSRCSTCCRFGTRPRDSRIARADRHSGRIRLRGEIHGVSGGPLRRGLRGMEAVARRANRCFVPC